MPIISMGAIMTEKDIETAKKKNKDYAYKKLLELLSVCPQVIPPSIGVETYLELLETGADLLYEKGYIEKPYPV
jgi:hypothetical protein